MNANAFWLLAWLRSLAASRALRAAIAAGAKNTTSDAGIEAMADFPATRGSTAACSRPETELRIPIPESGSVFVHLDPPSSVQVAGDQGVGRMGLGFGGVRHSLFERRAAFVLEKCEKPPSTPSPIRPTPWGRPRLARPTAGPGERKRSRFPEWECELVSGREQASVDPRVAGKCHRSMARHRSLVFGAGAIAARSAREAARDR